LPEIVDGSGCGCLEEGFELDQCHVDLIDVKAAGN
jgi:hypothetical protein